MRVNLEEAVLNLKGRKDITPLQPLYECIINSIDANATEIQIDIIKDEENMFNSSTNIMNGYKIRDNGEGFTKSNIQSFDMLFSQQKKALGCKGSGRLIWLYVFKDIQVVSKPKDESCEIDFKFDVNFDLSVINKTENNMSENSFTEITLQQFTGHFFSDGKDLRPSIDLKSIVRDIKKTLAVKFFILTRQGKNVHFMINYNDHSICFDTKDFQNFEEKRLQVSSIFLKKPVEFDVYYNKEKDSNSRKINFYLCSNARSTTVNTKSLIDKSFEQQLHYEYNFFVSSSLLDELSLDSRNDFDLPKNDKEISELKPISEENIINTTFAFVKEVISKNEPDLKETINKNIDEAINQAPYLSKYIFSDENKFKSCNELVKTAVGKFIKDKKEVTQKFSSFLTSLNIDNQSFIECVDNMSELASIELGEYIHFRNSIIQGLQKMDDTSKEEFLHNIFAKKHTICNLQDKKGNCYNTNLWLLDDKFMSFVGFSSDISFKGTNLLGSDATIDSKKRPDLLVYYEYLDDNKSNYDCVIIEFKRHKTDLKEKNHGTDELNDYGFFIRKNDKRIRNIYSFLITTLDDDFVHSLNIKDDYVVTPSFSGNTYCFYKYNKVLKMHTYITDVRTICEEAQKRNDVFLNILKKEYLKN